MKISLPPRHKNNTYKSLYLYCPKTRSERMMLANIHNYRLQTINAAFQQRRVIIRISMESHTHTVAALYVYADAMHLRAMIMTRLYNGNPPLYNYNVMHARMNCVRCCFDEKIARARGLSLYTRSIVGCIPFNFAFTDSVNRSPGKLARSDISYILKCLLFAG